jgi:hypothetical protein
MKRGELKKKLMDEIREEVARDQYDLCREILQSVFLSSPIWTGAYVGSHRITEKGKFTAPPEIREKGTWEPGSMGINEYWYPHRHMQPEAKRWEAYDEQLAKLARIFKKKSRALVRNIVILNEAPHAALVERRGTKYGDGFVYMRTAASFKGWSSKHGAIFR